MSIPPPDPPLPQSGSVRRAARWALITFLVWGALQLAFSFQQIGAEIGSSPRGELTQDLIARFLLAPGIVFVLVWLATRERRSPRKEAETP